MEKEPKSPYYFKRKLALTGEDIEYLENYVKSMTYALNNMNRFDTSYQRDSAIFLNEIKYTTRFLNSLI